MPDPPPHELQEAEYLLGRDHDIPRLNKKPKGHFPTRNIPTLSSIRFMKAYQISQ